MKVGTSRFVVVPVIACLLLVAGSTAAWAQSPNYTNFSTNQNFINLNGNAAFNGTALRVTPAAGSQTGSAWFNIQQPVKDGFTTTFAFQITSPSNPPGDGFAFVIQNATTGVNAIGFAGNGGALGYGDADGSTTNNTGAGIGNSIAIEFDAFANSWDLQNANHIAIQSCGAGNNTSHHNQVCVDGTTTNSTLSFVPVTSPTFADGAAHTVTITYVPPANPSSSGTLSVTLDQNSVTSIPVDLSKLLNLTAGDAYVGFTSATGASVENHDILSWTYQAQTVPQQTTVFNFPNNNYVVTPDAGSQPTTVQVTPILLTQNACNALVQANAALFVTPALTAQCFVYENADGMGTNSSVMYEVTCPSLGGVCSPFSADLGSTYNLPLGGNPLFNSGNPYPGWLKGDGGAPGHPCTPPSSGPLFVSNQVSFFDLSATDPFTKGKSGGTGSCWVATYNTPHEAPTVTITTPANGGNYAQGSTVNANYACAAVTTAINSPIGPYLTVAPGGCTGTVASGSPIDTTTVGPHSFTATVLDSATDNASSTVTYNVVAPADLAILNLAALKAPVNSTLTYAIGVGDLGGATAVGVTVTDTLPTGLTALSASGSNIACAVVNRRLTCTTASFTCSVGPTITCPVGPIMPLSWSSLNGATIQIKAKVTAPTGTVLKDTATVSSSNTDTKLSNNSSTATTTVTAH